MIEVFLILTGLVFAAWLYALVRQMQRGGSVDQGAPPRPVVPLNLRESDEAVLIAEGRGRIVYVNEPARQWFGIDGGAPNLSLMAQRVHPADALHDLLAGTGQAAFRLGQRQIEAVSHVIPTAEGQRTIVVMRELHADAVMTYTDYDPLRALAIITEISEASGKDMNLNATVEAIIRAVEPAVKFDAAEVTLWSPETETLRPVARNLIRTQTGRLIPPEDIAGISYRLGEGYSGWIAMYRQPLLINNVGGRTDIAPKQFAGDYQSYLGVPLIVNERFIGTLELTHTQRGAFSQRDVMLLQAVSGQIASSLQAAQLYEEQTTRVAELDGLQQISEAMSQLGETSELYGQLTQRIAALMHVDICGVLLFDESERVFRSQPPFYGAPDTLVRDYQLAVVPDTELYNIWHHQPWWFTNDPDSPMIMAMGLDDLRSAISVNNMALAPMIVGARRIGLLLSMNHHDQEGFAPEDMRRLMVYASQAAVVAENARLYADEQRRSRELGGLQQIAQAMGVLRSPTDLYDQVTQRIAELMDVTICGIMLFDPQEQVLVSQDPFYGLDDPESVRYYQLPSQPNSPVARLWQQRDTWFSNNIRRDPLAGDTDLAVLAPQMGITKTAIATLRVGGTRLGIIQAANKTNGADFTPDDARVLSIFAGQAAVLIDNARLYREMQRRTHEAEGLRVITEMVATAVIDDEIIERLLITVANLLEAGRVIIGLFDEDSGQLVIEPRYLWGADHQDDEARTYRLDTYAEGFENSVMATRRPMLSNNLRGDEHILPEYLPLIERLGLRSWLQVPLVIQDRAIGELTIANKLNGDFGDTDVELLQAIATQVSAMFDRVRLYETTDEALRRRIEELNALTRVSHELVQTLELDRILDVIRHEARRSTNAGNASIILLANRAEWDAEDEPAVERRFGESRALRELVPVERAAVLRNDVILIEHYANSEFNPQPQTAQSALVVPIMFGEQVSGALHLYSGEAGAFDQRAVDLAVSLTDQAAVALGNARRYHDQVLLNERLRERADQMARIFNLGEMFRQGASLEETLEEVAHGVQETVGFNVVLINLLDDRQGVMRRTAQAGLTLAVFEELQKTTPPLDQARSLMQDQYRVSNSYFLPVEGAGELIAELPVYQSVTERMGQGPRAWDPQDLLIVPLYGAGGRLLGMMSVDEPRSGRRPDINTIEALEIFANQAAFSIENYRLVARIREEAESARHERDRLAQLHRVASQIQAAEDVPERLQVVADGIRGAGWNHVVITLRDEHLEPEALIQSGYTGDEALTISEDVVPGTVWRAWINDLEFHQRKLGAGYYLRYNDPWVRANVLKDTPLDPLRVDDDQWHPQDILYMPLVGQQSQRIIGIISMDSPVDGRVPTEDSLQPFELFASQAAAAIETTQLYQETQRAAEQEQRINEVMEAVSAATRPPDVLKAIGHGLQQMVPFTRMSVGLYDEDKRHFDILRADIALDSTVTVVQDEPLPRENTAMGMVYATRTLQLYQLMHEPAARETLRDLQAWYTQGERSTLVVPMIAGGQVIGAMHLGSELENAFGYQESNELIQRLANLSAVAMDNARLFEQARQRATVLDAQAQRLAMINRISTRLVESLDPREIYRIALAELQAALGANYSGLVIFESETTGRLVEGTRAGDLEKAQVTIDLRENRSIAHVRETHKPLAAEDVLNDERFSVVWDTLRQRGTVSLLIVPLVVTDQVIGTIGLDFTEPHHFAPAELELAETIASQVSIALEKANLLSQTEQRARELNAQAYRLGALSRMSGQLAATFDTHEIYRIVLESMQEALDIDYGGLMLIQPGSEVSRLMLSTHPMDDPLPDLSVPLQGNPIAEYMLETRRPFISENIPEDPRFEAMWEIQAARNTEAMLIVPVVLGERVIGTIGLDSSYPRQFSEAEIDLAMTAANQAAVAIEKGRLFTEAQVRAEELDAQAQRMARVNEVSSRLAATLDTSEIYDIVLTELQDALNAQFAGLALFEGEETARMVADTHPTEQRVGQALIPLRGNRSIEIVRESHRSLVSADVLSDPVFEPVWDTLRERGTRSLMIVPLVVGGEVVGTIGIDLTEPHQFTDAEVELAETIAGQTSLAIEKARLYNETLGLTIFNQAVVESIQQGIVVLDQELLVRRINRFMMERYGWNNDAVGQALFDYRPDYADFLREPIAIVLTIGEPQVQYEVERRDEAGKPSIRNYYVYPMREGRQVTGIVLLLEDVTERAQLEADLQDRAIQMAALTEVSGQITATLEPDQVISLVLDALDRVIAFDGVALWLRVANEEKLVIAAARGYADPDAIGVDELVGLTVEIPYSPLFREMAENAQVINIGDVSAGDPRFPHGAAAIYKNWLGAPLISRGQVVGVIALEKREPNHYNELHEQLALTFANQAAVALYNAQLFEETRTRAVELNEQAQRLALLNRVSLALAQTLDLENIFEIALRETAIALGIQEGSAMQIDSSSGLAIAVVDYPRGDSPPSLTVDLARNTVIQRVRDNLIPIAVENSSGPLAEDLRKLLRREDVARALLVPLVVGGDVIGVLRLDQTRQERVFTPVQMELAQTIASQAGIAVQNAALFEQTAIRTRELETLFESAQATAVTLDLDEVVRRVTIQMLSALGTDSCTIFLWDDVNAQLSVRGEISARTEDMGTDRIGDVYELDDYPLRRRAVEQRELITIRHDDEDLPENERALLDRHEAAMRVLIPLIVNEVAIGLVEVETLDPSRYFKLENVRLARTLASQAAISIENARLQTETRRTVEELYIINDMSTALSSANSLEQLLDVIDAQLPSLTDAQWLYVVLYDADTGQLSYSLALDVLQDERHIRDVHPLGQDEFSLIVRNNAPLLLAGENIAEVRRSLGIETVMAGARCFLGVPLTVGEDVIGVLGVRDDSEPAAFSHNDQRILTTVGGQLGVAIQSTRLFQQTLKLAEDLDRRVQERTAELEQERQNIDTLYRITTELAVSLDMDRMLDSALSMVARAVGATQGAILAVEAITERLRFRARLGWDLPEPAESEDAPSLAMNEGLAGWAIQQRHALVVDDVQNHPHWLRMSAADDKPRSAIVALIETSEDVLGVMLLYSEQPGKFSEEHLQLVAAAANQIATAMNNSELYSLITEQAERLGNMLRQEQVAATQSTAIMDSVADGVMVVNAQGQVIVFNQAASRILGVSAENILNRPATEISGLYARGSLEWTRRLEFWMSAPTQYQAGEYHEEQITLEDGRTINVRLSPVNMDEQFLGTVSVFRDITREVEVDRLKSEFVATVSHELRTPMTSIKGYADLLLLGAAGEMSEQQQRFLDTIKQNADRLSVLVNDLLDISRIDQGRLEIKFNLLEVDDLLHAVAVHLRGRAEDEQRPMTVELDLPEDRDLTIWGDYDKVAQIMTNLADNAFNYTSHGGTITLGARVEDATENVILSVHDTGVGIPPEVADRVFERFFRGTEQQETVMDQPGTGLGLAIVNELVKAHHGRIWFESEVGQGTTFYVSLSSSPPPGMEPVSEHDAEVEGEA